MLIYQRVFTLTALISFPLQSFWYIPTTESIRRAVSEHKTATYSLAGTAALSVATIAFFKTDIGATDLSDDRIYWNWEEIGRSVTDIDFPEDFIFGVGTSAYQVEGNCRNADWWRWEEEQLAAAGPHVVHRSGRACDQWGKYEEDIALLAQMGVGIYRFSIAWDKVQPESGIFDLDAIEYYKNVCRELARFGIQAHIGFHHYTDPIWFADLGGFTLQENAHYFAEYCAYVLEQFNDIDNVKLWSTFNSPSGYAMHKYHSGDFPPGIRNDTQQCMTVLKNMMEAHVQAYRLCKEINPQAQIGILKNIIFMDPWRPWHPVDNFTCSIGEKMMHDPIFSFFTTGRFVAKIPYENAPFMADVEYTNLDAPNTLDFIGLNYYSHCYLKNFGRMIHPGEIPTQNPNYVLYPEGLYRAIKLITEKMVQPIEQLNGKHLPIYVTENGVASDNPGHRDLFFKRYLYALDCACKDGYDVRGYIFWSFMDNYEWGSYDKKYGIVHIDFASDDLTRTLKTDIGTRYFLDVIARNSPAVAA